MRVASSLKNYRLCDEPNAVICAAWREDPAWLFSARHHQANKRTTAADSCQGRFSQSWVVIISSVQWPFNVPSLLTVRLFQHWESHNYPQINTFITQKMFISLSILMFSQPLSTIFTSIFYFFIMSFSILVSPTDIGIMSQCLQSLPVLSQHFLCFSSCHLMSS